MTVNRATSATVPAHHSSPTQKSAEEARQTQQVTPATIYTAFRFVDGAMANWNGSPGVRVDLVGVGMGGE